MCVCLGGEREKIEIITQRIVSHTAMRQRHVFAREEDERSAARGFSWSYRRHLMGLNFNFSGMRRAH